MGYWKRWVLNMSKLSSRGQYLRFEKGTRYYTLVLDKDLFGDWVITKANGRINSRLGQIKNECCFSYKNAVSRFQELVWHRQFKKNYKVI